MARGVKGTGKKRRRYADRQGKEMAQYMFGDLTSPRARHETPEQRSQLLHLCDVASTPKFADFAARLRECSNIRAFTVMREAGVTFHEIVAAFRQAKLDEGTIKMYQHLPDVMEDVAKDARTRERTCQRCKGTGHAPTTSEAEDSDAVETCLDCEGTGKVTQMGDAGARKLLFDAAGLTSKVGVQVNQQFNHLDGSEPLESMVTSTRTVLSPAPAIRTLPAEVIPSGE